MAGFLTLLTLWQVCETLVPVAIGLVIDKAVATSDLSALLWSGAGICLLFLVLSLSYRFGARMGFTVVQWEMHRLRLEITGRSLDPRGVADGPLTGQTLSLATSDTDNVGFTIRSLGYSLAAIGSLVIAAVVLLRIDVGLGLTVLIGVPVVVLVLQALTPLIARRTTKQEEAVSAAAGVATDLVRGIRVVQGLSAEDEASRRYRRISRHAWIAGIRNAEAFGSMIAATQLAGGLFLALVALLAGNLALDGEISIGELVVVVGLSSYLTSPIQVIGSISAQIARARASAERIVTHLQAKARVAAGDVTPDAAAPWRCTAPDFESTQGELLGIVVADAGRAEALLARLADGDSGITVGDVPLDEVSLEARRDLVVVNPHRVDLFEGTLAETITPAVGCSPAALTAALEASAATDVVDLSPDGLDQRVHPDGATHSGGQRQRISLARALLADPPLLVLHDPTSAVDAVTEHRIAQGLRGHRHGAGSNRSTWLVTTSPALLAVAHRVVLVEDDRVVATGTHHDLTDHPTYRELVLR
ncbi:ABC transporter ATP-binding protein [Nocardioides alcanivorans]|uniref:ABC transporter ATP-binding protein n=1 Tax=Nocardioides alcanivorans TaxID=2897352 RepID=UPI001F45A518|nr:ABC transporter ATP-binding protein [Nocardioides alcanivorans]